MARSNVSVSCLVLLTLFGLLGSGLPSARACPMCKEAISASANSDEDDPLQEARAYNRSIYLMVGMPYLLLGGISFSVYLGYRRKQPHGSIETAR